MMDFIATLVSIFLTGPLQAELSEKLAAARAPQAIVAQVTDCAAAAAPVILDKVVSDPWWAATNVVRVWAGLARADSVLIDAAPACRPAIDAARPFLGLET